MCIYTPYSIVTAFFDKKSSKWQKQQLQLYQVADNKCSDNQKRWSKKTLRMWTKEFSEMCHLKWLILLFLIYFFLNRQFPNIVHLGVSLIIGGILLCKWHCSVTIRRCIRIRKHVKKKNRNSDASKIWRWKRILNEKKNDNRCNFLQQ